MDLVSLDHEEKLYLCNSIKRYYKLVIYCTIPKQKNNQNNRKNGLIAFLKNILSHYLKNKTDQEMFLITFTTIHLNFKNISFTLEPTESPSYSHALNSEEK